MPYNAAAKATPPSVQRKTPNYFQPEEIAAILDALEDEPEKWRVFTHFLIVTGCRRGEIAALKWSKIDLNKGRLEISANFCNSKEKGIYETTTKTGTTRYMNIPKETIALLKNTGLRSWSFSCLMETAGRTPATFLPRMTVCPCTRTASPHGCPSFLSGMGCPTLTPTPSGTA